MSKIAFGVFVLVVAALILGFLAPGMRDATTNNQTATLELEEGEPQDIETDIRVNATTVDSTNQTVNTTVTDLESYERASVVLDVGNSTTVQLAGENVTVTVDDARNSVGVVSLEYAGLYGWDAGPRGLVENTGLLILIVAMVLVFAVVGYGVQ